MDEDQSARRVAQKYLKVVDADYYEFESKNDLKFIKIFISRSAHLTTNYEFRIFATNFLFFTFSVVLPGKGFKLHHNSTKKCQYNSLH